MKRDGRMAKPAESGILYDVLHLFDTFSFISRLKYRPLKKHHRHHLCEETPVMSNDHERIELLAKIRELLGAVDLVQACLDNPTDEPGLLEASREALTKEAFEMRALIILQHSVRQRKLLDRKPPSLSSSLLAGAQASEYQAQKLLSQGDEAGAQDARQNADMLRAMAAEESVKERRQAMRIVPTSSPPVES